MTILLCNNRLAAALILRSIFGSSKRRQLFSISTTAGSLSKSDKLLLDNLVTRRSFLIPSFELHGGVSGLFDFGPPGFALKENILSLWKSHFVIEDGLLQIESAALTPHVVLKASGHVDKFEDVMVKDVKTGECYRADKLLEEHLQTMMLSSSSTSKESEGRKGRADGAGAGENKSKQKEGGNISRAELASLSAKVSSLSLVEIAHVISRLQIKSPNNNDLSPPFPFNLMFATSIGPTGTQRAFLRPETAQGMFLNFKRLYDFNGGRLPMGVAQIGLAFRNEIAPRGGLLRVREFTLAEIEYFVHPEKKKHHNKFDSIKNISLPLLTARTQQQQVADDSITPLPSSPLPPSQTIPVQTPLHVAVNQNDIGNETLAYFMARTYMFLLAVGINPECVRFREHMPNEMAHYAASCWDAEILTSQGWVECVGLADRSAFDLESHSSATGVDMVAREKLAEPIEEPFIAVKANRREIGRTHRGDQAFVVSALESIAENKTLVEDLERKLVEKGSADVALSDGRTVSVTRAMVSFEKGLRKISEKKFTPHVIEPSFGIGRIMAALLEHSFYVRREDLSEVKGKDAGLVHSLSSTSISTDAASTTQDLSRCVLRFSPLIAPYKAVLLPLDGRVDSVMVRSLSRSLASAGLSAYVDDSSNSIGKRYARADELGVPFAITVDFESAKDAHVTIRERDSTLQTRIQVESVIEYIRKRVVDV